MTEEKVKRTTQKQLLWQRLQIEAPDLAVFMKKAKTKFNAQVEEIKLGGKIVWKR